MTSRVCLNAWCFEPDARCNVTKGAACSPAYARRRGRSSADELHALPMLARGAALRFLLHPAVRLAQRAAGARWCDRRTRSNISRKLRFHQAAASPSAITGIDLREREAAGVDPYRRRLLRQSGAGRLGARSFSRDHQKELKGGEPHDHQQPHGADGGDRGARGAEAAVPESTSTPTAQYLRDGITSWIQGWKRNGWRTADKKPVKNADLWQRLERPASPPRRALALGQGAITAMTTTSAPDLLARECAPRTLAHRKRKD